jgi:predicted HicB family RNase H-like nuclease
MPGGTITFRVDDAERNELIARAEREKISLSDYIRVKRAGLPRGRG